MKRLTIRPSSDHFDPLRERLFRHPSVNILTDDDHQARIEIGLEMSKEQSDRLVDIMVESEIFVAFSEAVRASDEDELDLTITQVGMGRTNQEQSLLEEAQNTFIEILKEKNLLIDTGDFEDFS